MRGVSIVLLCCVAAVMMPLVQAHTSDAKLDGPGIPTVSDADVEEALTLAGANRGELKAALDSCIQKPFMMAAMRFVVVSLPLADLGSISAEMLIENLDLAMDSYFSFGYADYSPATWAHYVLPPRVSQEPLSEWRRFFHAEIRTLVMDCGTLEEAAIVVNKWCAERVRFEQTARRDQGPLTTLKSGYGRCEEMMIVYIDALRSVGIPARNAYCPWWSWGDNNHAWTEILGSDGRWHFAESCSTADELDNAWFGNATKRAPVICSMCFGLPDELGDDVLRYKDEIGSRFCQINSISFYRDTGKLHVEILAAVSAASDPMRSYKADDSIEHWLYVYVFNFGALRPVAKVRVDDDCNATIELGAGKYALSTNLPVAEPMVWATVVNGEDIAVNWLDAPALPAELLLEFPADDE